MLFSQLSYLYRLYSLKNNLHLYPDEIKKLQEAKLKVLLRYAYNKVGHYRRIFDEAAIKPGDIKTLQDLGKIPITTKQKLRGTPKEEVIGRDISQAGLFNLRTSGSTGEPLDIFVSRRELALRYAFYRRMYLENGAKLTEKELAITTPSNFLLGNWFERFGILRKKSVSVSWDMERQLNTAISFNPDIIGGYTYSSGIKNLAVEIKKKQIKTVRPRLIFSTAELLTKQDRAFISEVFQGELFDYYSCNECGIIAWECRRHFGYHINSDNVIVEFVKADGSYAKPQEEGDVVVTSLNSYVMPFIRYRLEDVAVPFEKSCQCGINFPMMRIVAGRNNDYFLMSGGRRISPFAITESIEHIPGMLRYQVIQEGHDKVRINVVKDRKYASDIIQNLRSAARDLFGDATSIEVSIVQELSNNRVSGKFQAVKSLIKNSREND